MSISSNLTILSNDEIQELYTMPQLKQEEIEILFLLSEVEKQYIDNMPTLPIPAKINLIVQLGYFKASRNLYKFSILNVRAEVWFVIGHYFPGIKFPKKNININQHYNNQKAVLAIYGYQRANHDSLSELAKQAAEIVKRDASPRFVFDQLLDYCEHQKIIRPGYSTLQSIVAAAVFKEEERLTSKISMLVDQETKKAIDNLLTIDDLFYILTSLKKDPKNFSTNEMKAETIKQQTISGIYSNIKSIVSQLGISRHNIQYYASLAEYYSIYSLKRMQIEKARLYLICFVLQRFWKINDHLISYLLYKTNYYASEAKKYAVLEVYKAKIAHDKDAEKAAKILKIIADDKIHDNMIRSKSFKIVEKDKLNTFANDLAKPKFEDLPYIIEYYNKNYHAIRLNLRATFKSLNFTYDKETPIKAAIVFFKDFLNKKGKLEQQPIKNIPTDFIPKRMRRYVINKMDQMIGKKIKKVKYINGYVNGNLYEIILYLEIEKAIGSKVFISESENYRSLEEELIPLAVWDKNKEEILSSLANCVVSLPFEEIVQPLETKLEKLYYTVNARIRNGKNRHIKVNVKTSKWKLPYEKQDEEINNPLFDKMPRVDLVDVISYVAEQTGFMEHFTHILSKNIKSSAKLEHLAAYIIGSGTGLGKGRMAESSDITTTELDSLELNFIRLETLKNASNSIINKMEELPIYKHFNLSEYGVHSSVDGQKLTTRYQTAKARYSRKYLGSSMGVVAYSLIANHIPINSIIIGANEHESQYLVDIYLNNRSNIKPISISSDMHGINRFNGGLLNLLKCQFMPRFTKIYKTSTKNLVGFKDKCLYTDLLIKPATKVDKPLISGEWDAIMRIVASLANKQSSQNVIIRKLTSYKSNQTLKALAQYDRIVMSIYMLTYIDDINVRRLVQRALNRGEAFHQLRAALMAISGKHLQGRTDYELAISNECNRLLAICIIYYNCVLLSFLINSLDKKKDKELYELITRLSPVAWQHINMIGKFQFLENKKIINIKSFIDNLMDDLRKDFKPLRPKKKSSTKSF